MTFFDDLSTHARFLLVVPLLLMVEASIGRRTRMVAAQFAESNIVTPADRPRFDGILRRACRAFDSALAEAVVAALAHRMPEKAPPDLSGLLRSPMPGLLLRLAVAEGDSVKAGEELAVVEAMKMENVLRAERDGVIKKIHAGPGESLAVDQSILEFE